MQPGYTVDSYITILFLDIIFPTDSEAFFSGSKFGLLESSMGVGTVIIYISTFAKSSNVDENLSFLAAFLFAAEKPHLYHPYKQIVHLFCSG